MQTSDTDLKRHIGLGALILFGVGDILGAGIYGLVGKAAGEMGNAVWLAFFVSMVAAGLTGLSYASLGSRHPRAGGAAFVIHRAFRSGFLAYVIGLAVLCSGLTSMAAASRAFAGYLVGMVPVLPMWIAVILFASFIGFVVFWGIRESMWLNIFCTTVELLGLLFIVVIGVRYWGSVDYLDASTMTNPEGLLHPSILLAGAVLTFYSFVGFEDMLNVSEEVIDPQRVLPKGLLGAVAISSTIYMAVSITAVSVVDAKVLAASTQPLVDVVRQAAPWFPSDIFSFVAMFAIGNTALLNFIMGSRLIYGMSKQGLLPRKGANVHPTRRTPHVAIGAVFVIMLILATTGDISSLARATSVLLLISFFLMNISLIILKRRSGEKPGFFEVPYIIPVGGAAICFAMLLYAKFAELITAGILLAVIVVLYFVVRPSTESLRKMEA